MEFRVLGPLEVRVDDRPLALGGTRPRVVLAALLLGRNAVVPVERLVAAIWGENPPGTPTAQIQAAVSALRKTLGADRIVTRSPGYLVRVEHGELDLDEFDREVAAARRARDECDVARAAARLHAALEWWRDDALVDLAELPVRTTAVSVDERRWTVWEERIEADLALRRHAELLPELSALVTKKPLRDRLWSQLMRAQYRSGRRADALETYRRARSVMRDELGLEPAAELAALHRAILADDPALDPEELPLGTPSRTRPPCPYRALEAYQPGDATAFFGRSAEVAAVVARARTGPVTVVGPSGAGKSSLVLAGVLPALAGTTALVVRPSDHGRVDLALAAAVARVLPADDVPDPAALADRITADGLAGLVDEILARSGDEGVTVVLDQAEELLDQDADLVDRVVGALFTPTPRLTVLATLRADHLGEVLARPVLSGTLGGRGVFTLGAPGPDQLREVVTAPLADLPGIGFQAGLVDRILDDVGTEPGTLSLLGLTLTLLWDDQVDGALTHRAYDELGRVPGALATHAEREWRRHNLAVDEPVVRRLVGRLVQVRAGGQVTRRVAARHELDDTAWRLAQRLAATRLLVVTGDAGGARVELAHETLTTHWPRLRGWVDDDVDFQLWRTALRADVERWQHAGRDTALLARGTVLAQARDWLGTRGPDLGPDETEYVRRSAQQQRTTGRRGRLLRVGLAAAAALVLVLGTVFTLQRDRTAVATADAESRELAATAVGAAGTNPTQAALLAIAAYDRAPTTEAGGALFDRYRDLGGLDALYTAGRLQEGNAAASDDGRVVAGGRATDEVVVFVRDPGKATRTLSLHSPGRRFALTPDGSAVWTPVPDGIGRRDTATGADRTVVRTSWVGTPHISVSADGTRVVLADRPDVARPTYRVREWRTTDGAPTAETTFTDPRGNLFRAGPRPGSALVGYRSDDAYAVDELDLGTGARSPLIQGTTGAVAGDGSAAVACSAGPDGAVVTGVRTADRGPLGRAALPDAATSCPQLVAGPDGRAVANLGLPDIRVIDLGAGTTERVTALWETLWVGHIVAGLTPDGSRLVVNDGVSIAVADLSAPGATAPVLRSARLLDGGRGVVAVTGDGRSLVVEARVAGGPTARVARPSAFVDDDAGVVLQVARSGVVADRTAADEVTLRRLPGLDPLATVRLPGSRLDAMYFDTADRLVTVADRQVSWWDGGTGALTHRVELPRAGPGLAVAATPDPGRLAVSVADQPDVTVHDAADGHVVDTLPLGTGIEHVRFQRTSDDVLVSRRTSTEVWDRRTRTRVFGPFPVAEGAARVAGMLAPAGRFMTLDQRSGAWQVRTWQVGRPDPLTTVALSSSGTPGDMADDGAALGLLSTDGDLAAVVSLDPAVWRGELCRALAGADLTDADRAAYPALPPGPVCGAGRSPR